MSPIFSGSSPPFDPAAPSPTEFTGYLGALNNSTILFTSIGTVRISFNAQVGVRVSISPATVVPEPAGWVGLASIGCVALRAGMRRRS
ncbi:MAG: hypothetical protein SFX72_13990 [Isosphaeraceae bacterium]|nr:hypothetical protein [Isosphaeraceae bacterium]